MLGTTTGLSENVQELKGCFLCFFIICLAATRRGASRFNTVKLPLFISLIPGQPLLVQQCRWDRIV